MTEAERYLKRRAYFRAYSKANRAKRGATSKRWREDNRARYNEMQRENNRRWREAHGAKPRPAPQAPKAVKPTPVAAPKPAPRPPITCQAHEGLSARFRAYRAALRT